MSPLISVLIVIVAVIPAVFLVNLLPIPSRAKDIVGAIVGIVVVFIAVFSLLKYVGAF